MGVIVAIVVVVIFLVFALIFCCALCKRSMSLHSQKHNVLWEGESSEVMGYKTKGVIVSTLIDEVRSPVPYSPLQLPNQPLHSQNNAPKPTTQSSPLSHSTLMDANRRK